MLYLALQISLLMAGLLVLTASINLSGVLHGRGSIAYVSSPQGNPDILLMDVDRGLTRQIVRHAAQDLRPAWSPDGRNIIFYSNRDGFWNLYLMRSSGLDVRQLTTAVDSYGDPAWSPDGRRLAYDATLAGNQEIYIMECDEALIVYPNTNCAIRRLTEQSGPDEFPAWSPDGQYIVYQALHSESREIYIVQADADAAPQLVYTGYFSHAGPTWSPDGQKLAFTAASTSQWSIYSVDAKCYTLPGGCAGKTQQLTPATMNSFQPAWSPDGRSIVFQGWIDGNMELFVMDADGENLRRLTYDRVDDRLPAWWP